VLEERHAVDQLHREEPVAARVQQLAEPHQVAVLEIGAGAELGLQPVQRVGVDRAQGLERHHQLALAIVGLVHQPHAALTDEAAQLEARVALEAGGRGATIGGRVGAHVARRRHASIVTAWRLHAI
jgi:hypothetical protein